MSAFNPDFLQIYIECHDFELTAGSLVKKNYMPKILIYELRCQLPGDVNLNTVMKKIGDVSLPYANNDQDKLYQFTLDKDVPS